LKEELQTLILNNRDEINQFAATREKIRKQQGEDKRRMTVIKNRYDAIGNMPTLVSITIGRVKLAYFGVFDDLSTLGLASEVFNRTSQANKAQLEKQFKAILGASPLINDRGLREKAAEFTAQNVSLIRNMEQSVFSKIETDIIEGLNTGLRHEELIATIQEKLDVGESRARLIARDQTQKANSSLNELRQTNLGIKKYRWQTSEDERVRKTHVDNNNLIFLWAEPPEETGHPGNDINCRCVAAPEIEDFLDGLSD
jgi:SPP1 gp7 family putative phage head morphogenesis protein